MPKEELTGKAAEYKERLLRIQLEVSSVWYLMEAIVDSDSENSEIRLYADQLHNNTLGGFVITMAASRFPYNDPDELIRETYAHFPAEIDELREKKPKADVSSENLRHWNHNFHTCPIGWMALLITDLKLTREFGIKISPQPADIQTIPDAEFADVVERAVAKELASDSEAKVLVEQHRTAFSSIYTEGIDPIEFVEILRASLLDFNVEGKPIEVGEKTMVQINAFVRILDSIRKELEKTLGREGGERAGGRS